MLSYSLATHLLEQGVDTMYIQELLSHNNSKTTDLYARFKKGNR